MKKLFIVAAAGVACITALAACSSGARAASYQTSANTATLVAFTAPEIYGDLYLKGYLDGLAERELITYTLENGMITSVNGTKNDAASGSYWMLYSDLTELDGVEYGNAEWGTYEYGGKTLASCTYGAEGMPVVEGYTYAVVYQTF